MSATKNKTIRIKTLDSSSGYAGLRFEFDRRLQYKGSDYRIYLNNFNPNNIEPQATELLRFILGHLFTDTSGVESVDVGPFWIMVQGSRAVPSSEIKQLVIDGICAAGFDFKVVD